MRGTLVEPMLKTCVLKQYLLKDCWDLKRKLWWLKTSYHVKALVLEEELAPNEESMIPFRCTPSFGGYLKTWTLSPIALGNIVIRTIVLDGVIVGVSRFVGSGVALSMLVYAYVSFVDKTSDNVDFNCTYTSRHKISVDEVGAGRALGYSNGLKLDSYSRSTLTIYQLRSFARILTVVA